MYTEWWTILFLDVNTYFNWEQLSKILWSKRRTAALWASDQNFCSSLNLTGLPGNTVSGHKWQNLYSHWLKSPLNPICSGRFGRGGCWWAGGSECYRGPALSSPHPAIPCAHGSPSWIKIGCPNPILTPHSAKAGRKCMEHHSKTKTRNPKEETFIKLFSLRKF